MFLSVNLRSFLPQTNRLTHFNEAEQTQRSVRAVGQVFGQRVLAVDLGRLGSGLAALLCFAACLQTAHADDLTVQVTQGGLNRLTVAVVPFAQPAELSSVNGVDYASVIAADLEHSGRFSALDAKALPQNPHALTEIDVAQWRLVKADYVLVGKITAGSETLLDFAAINVLTNETLFHYVLPVSASNPRRDAHRIANILYEKITGYAGVFDTKVAYVGVEGVMPRKHWKLIVSDYDGENPRVILDSSEPLMSPTFSADGTEIAYVSFEGRHSQVFVQQLSTGSRSVVSERLGVNGAPAFSPDGKYLALTLSQPNGNLDVYVLNRTNQGLTRITDDPGIDTEATFTPDGKNLLFTSDRSGRPQLYKIDWQGGSKAQRISFEGPYTARARVSADGKSAAVVALDGGGYRIGIMDLSNGQLRIVSNGTQDTSASFAPNGQMLVYASKRGAQNKLAIVSLDGVVSILKSQGDVRDPVWCPVH